MMSVPPWRKTNAAYTAVSTKTTLSRPTPPQPAVTPVVASSGSKTQWPDSLKTFVAHCFDQVTTEDTPTMETQLKEVITKAFELGSTWTIDWSKATLPILELRKREKKRLLSKESSPLTSSKKVKPNKKKKFNTFALNEKDEKREQRLKRFETASSVSTTNNNRQEPTNLDEPVVGQSTKLEKRYLRLTSAPDPASVRPLYILKQTLELLKTKWKEEQNYSYICDQFKSMRQDLTVQHIQNDFTVLVYEIHARIALEKGDLGEYNQCQSQLKVLYSQGIPGHNEEFLAYRMLYLLHTGNHADISDILLDLEIARANGEPLDNAVAHALKVNTAMSTKNFHQLFRLYVDAPNMGGYVMDSFIKRERYAALSAICRGMRPSVELEYLVSELGFTDEDEFLEFAKASNLLQFLKSSTSQETDKISKVMLQTKEAYPIIEQQKLVAFAKVDIKGQI